MPRPKTSNGAISRTRPRNPSAKARSRHRSTKNPSSKASRAVGESQNTLTQLDFVHIFHPSHDEDSQNEDEEAMGREMEDDELEEEGVDYQDDDFVPENPKKRKRRRPTVSNKRQQTLTQIDWTPRATFDREEEEHCQDDDEGRSPSPAENDSYRPAYSESDESAENKSYRSRQGTPANFVSSMTEKRTFDHNALGRANEGSGRLAAQGPSTPKTARAQIVPSSQTPDSTPFSRRSTRHSKARFARSVTRSPLTELSSNRRSMTTHPSPDTSLKKNPSTGKSLQTSPGRTPNPRNKTTFASRLVYDSEADSLEDDDDEEEKAATTLVQPISRQGMGVDGAAMLREESQELPRLRTDSEEISSQINRELFFFTQQQYESSEQRQNDGHGTTGSPIVAADGETPGETDNMAPQEIRQSQVSTVDVTQEPHSSRSRRLSSLPPVGSSSPNLPRIRNSPIVIASSPVSTRSKGSQQGAITLSQLLPESLMAFSLPPPPSPPQYDENERS
ncbi:MAG: hypothetical protein Q9165_006525 [Trypethelium subeluteriae]